MLLECISIWIFHPTSKHAQNLKRIVYYTLIDEYGYFDVYLHRFYQEFIKKRSQPIKFVIGRKSREEMVCN